MLQITPHHRILLAVRFADFRKGIDGLVALCRQSLDEDPFKGTVFVFTNRRRTCIKIIIYDGQGFWLCHKRFSRGRLAWWPTQQTASFSLSASQLLILLSQGHPLDVHIPADWRPVIPFSSTPPGREEMSVG